MNRPTDPEITWTLPLSQANAVMNFLGKQEFNLVADIIVELRNQAAAQIQLYQQQAAQSAETAAAASAHTRGNISHPA